MNKSIPLKTYAASALLCLTLFASCSTDDDTALPEGKYPMTFATAMEGLTQTRATTDNTWAGGEKIAVQVDGEVKQYIPKTSGQKAKLTGVDAANTFYWQKTDETKQVSAWYCGTGYKTTLPPTWTVNTDQSGDGYAESDLLYAMPQNIAYSGRDKELTFNHLPAKVVINLTKGNGLTDENIRNATVSLFCQAITSGKIEKSTGIMEQAATTGSGSGSTAITPNVLTNSGYQKSVQAIVVPQQVAGGTQFIKVTIGENTDARDYYYTTKTADEANFECGKQYTYNITVTKGKELEVTDQKTVTWQEGAATSGTVKPATEFNVTCPQGSGVSNFNIENAVPQSGDKYTVNANTITISYTTSFKRRRYNLVQGIAKVSTPINENGTIKFTVSDIRGDLVFSFDEYAEVGDYYYADGTWSPDYLSGSGSPACIGIVFKVGAGEGDDVNYYGDKLPKGIRGYVAALKDANDGNQLAWSTETTATGVSTSQVNFDGYSNTQIIKRISGYETKYPAFQSCIENNGTAAPGASSGWYLPSCAQIKAFHDVHGSVRVNFDRASGKLLITNSTGDKRGDYWTSNEDTNDRTNVWHYSTYIPPFYIDHKKTDTDKDLVRAILTF